MKLEGYNPKYEWWHPEGQKYYERWVKQYPAATTSDLVVSYVADHDPFIALISQSDREFVS